MPRSVNAVASKQRRKKILKETKGYFGSRKNVWTVAKNSYEKGLQYAYRDRRKKKANFQGFMDTTYQCRCKTLRNVIFRIHRKIK